MWFFNWFCRIKAHFENVQRIADSTTLPHAINYFRGRIAEELELSQLLEKLLRGKEHPTSLSPSEKLQLWDRLKILSKKWLCFCFFAGFIIRSKMSATLIVKEMCFSHVICFFSGFTRMVVSLWAVTMLSLYIRVQVNILGRHLYIDTAQGLGSSHLPVSFH